MARWTAKCWLGSSNGYQNCEVDSNTMHGAQEQLRRIYGAEQIINLRKISSSGSSSGSSETMSFGNMVAIFILIIGGISVIAYLPFVLSGVLGWFGTKTALSIDQRDTAFKNMKNTFLAKTYMVLILSAVCGGVGFFGGDYIEKNHMGDAPQELRNNLKVFFQ